MYFVEISDTAIEFEFCYNRNVIRGRLEKRDILCVCVCVCTYIRNGKCVQNTNVFCALVPNVRMYRSIVTPERARVAYILLANEPK